VNNQLLLEQKVLCNDGTATAWLHHLGYRREQVK